MNDNLADHFVYLALYDENGLSVDVQRLSPTQTEIIRDGYDVNEIADYLESMESEDAHE